MKHGPHLTDEALARLVDEPESKDEAGHLRRCGRCASALAAMRAQTEALGDLPALEPPGDTWSAIEIRLRDEGLIGPERPYRRDRSAAWMRGIAALLLFIGGTGFGLLLGQSNGDPAMSSPREMIVDSEEVTLETAEAYVRQTQEMQLAALFVYRDLIERAGGTAVGDPLLRVALYDHLLAAAEAAIREAPADPFLNGVFVNTVAERQMALDELAMTSAGIR